MGNCCQCNKEKSLSDSQIANNDLFIQEKEPDNYKKYLFTEVINNIPSSPTEPMINTNESQKNSRINFQKNTSYSYNKIGGDRPEILYACLKNEYTNHLQYLISEPKDEENNYFSVSLVSLEKKLFKLINDLRTNPKSFINIIEEYKNQLQKNNDFYYLIIDDNIFQFSKGKEYFDECINFLKGQECLKKFKTSPSMFESKAFFKDQNVSDLNFVLLYNLMDIKSPEDNKIRRNCLTSKIYNKLNITITKDDFDNGLYTYHFSFDE